MKRTLLFDFSVNKEKKTIQVKREIDASIDLVWAAWTEPELIDQWWAPKPYQAKTKSMDFREGGHWLYAMVGPDGIAHWCRADFKKIEVRKYYSGLDNFCNEAGEINKDFPQAFWQNSFSEQDSITLVEVLIEYESLSDLEKYIEMGFKEGFTAALENLDQYVEAQFKHRK